MVSALNCSASRQFSIPCARSCRCSSVSILPCIMTKVHSVLVHVSITTISRS